MLLRYIIWITFVVKPESHLSRFPSRTSVSDYDRPLRQHHIQLRRMVHVSWEAVSSQNIHIVFSVHMSWYFFTIYYINNNNEKDFLDNLESTKQTLCWLLFMLKFIHQSSIKISVFSPVMIIITQLTKISTIVTQILQQLHRAGITISAFTYHDRRNTLVPCRRGGERWPLSDY